MAKKITFDIELNVNGQNMVVRASQDVRELQKAVSTVKDGTRRAVDEFVAWGGVVTTIQGVTNGIQQLGGALLELANDYNAQEEAELKLQTVMRQRMKASDDDVDAIKRLASAQQEIGVVGDEVQLAGAQQVATFLNEKRSIEQLLPAMNNLAVQRKGLNVTAEDMVNIGNLVGKVMQGNVGALTRVGITFTEAEQKALKAGTEGERAAMLAKIITNNVGEMNAELAKTDAGHAKQLANSIGDVKEQVGQTLASWQPLIQLTSQIGMSIMGLSSMATAIGGMGKSLGILSLFSRGAAAAQNLFGMAVRGVRAFVLTGSAANAVYSRTLTATSAASRTAAVSATTLGIAIRGLLVATGVGAAIVALTSIISSFVGESDEAAGATDKLTEAQQRQKDATQQEEATLKDVRSGLELNIQKLKNFHGTQQQEKALVQEMNTKYGETLGYFSSVSEWYHALTKDSKSYTQQMILEARARSLANQIAEHQNEIDNIRYDSNGRTRKYSKQRQMETTQKYDADAGVFVNVPTGREVVGSSDWEKATAEVRQHEQAIKSLTARLNETSTAAQNVQYAVTGAETAPTGTHHTTGRSPNKSTTPKETVSVDFLWKENLQETQNDIRKELAKGKYDPLDERSGKKREQPRMRLSSELGPDKKVNAEWNAYTKHVNNARLAQEKLQKQLTDQKSVADSIGSIAQSFSSLGQTIGGVGGNMIQVIGQLASTAASAIGQLVALAAAQGMSNAFKLPFPGNLAAWATVIGAVVSGASTIAGFARMKFANGGLAYGPTLGLVGEYPGASNNPEVIAPLDKLRSIIQPATAAPLEGNVVFRIKGRTLEGVLERRMNYKNRT